MSDSVVWTGFTRLCHIKSLHGSCRAGKRDWMWSPASEFLVAVSYCMSPASPVVSRHGDSRARSGISPSLTSGVLSFHGCMIDVDASPQTVEISPISPGSGSQSWLFSKLISLAVVSAERVRDSPLYFSPSRRATCSKADHSNVLWLFPISERLRALQSGWSHNQHLPTHIMSVPHTWLSAPCRVLIWIQEVETTMKALMHVLEVVPSNHLFAQVHQSPFLHLPRYPARS